MCIKFLKKIFGCKKNGGGSSKENITPAPIITDEEKESHTLEVKEEDYISPIPPIVLTEDSEGAEVDDVNDGSVNASFTGFETSIPGTYTIEVDIDGDAVTDQTYTVTAEQISKTDVDSYNVDYNGDAVADAVIKVQKKKRK